MTDKNEPPKESIVDNNTEADKKAEENANSEPAEIDLSKLSLDDTLVGCEQFYDLVRRTPYCEELNVHLNNLKNEPTFNVNELLKNGDTLLCLCCTKAYDKLVKTLVEEFSADVNLCRSIATTSSSFSTITPTISISARRQSRLMGAGTGLGSSIKATRGDTPLSICIKYGHEALAEYLIDKCADISGSDSAIQDNENCYADFERSPLQDAVRLSRTKIVEKMLQSMFVRDDIRTIEWVFAKRNDILRQVLMTENLETMKVILPNIIENKRIDGEMLVHILNYLLMKSKIQERKEKVTQIIETVMEISTQDEDNNQQFEIYNLDVFIRGFLATLKALFNSVSGDNSRTDILEYRTSLFFFIMKYQKALINFEEFYPDIDTTFDFFYTKMSETGENVLKLVEYFISFYDTLITMNHIRLTSQNVASLLRLEHVKKVDILGNYLIQRSLIPLDLKEIVRLKIKENMPTYNLESINDLPILNEDSKEFLFYY